MANFIFIHGTGGNPDECFYPWLRQLLEKKGNKVYAPQLSRPAIQTLQSWMKDFEPYAQYVNEETVFVGRSIGAAFILRLLEKTKARVKAAFLVGGFCSELEMEEFEPLVRTFIEKPFNWKKIRANCGRFLIYNSDNDPFVPLEKGQELAKNLGTNLTLVKGAKHFWFDKFPKIAQDIKKI